MFPLVGQTSVLIVEDDAPLRELYRTALKRNGYLVTAVDDGLTALHHIEAERPDVIVLDMALPRLGGRDVLRELRANPSTRAIPIIIVTGTDVADLNERAFSPVLQKPVDTERLVHEIEMVVRRVNDAAGRA